jgi:hypothetical protein
MTGTPKDMTEMPIAEAPMPQFLPFVPPMMTSPIKEM